MTATNPKMCMQDTHVQDSSNPALARVRMGGYVGEQARATLVNEHYPWIVSRCTQFLGNEADGNDAAQEVALCMYRSLPRFQGRSLLKTWLSRIIRNECVNLIRRQQKNSQIYQLLALAAVHEQEMAIHQQRAEGERDEMVQEALATLDREHREVLELRFFSELPIAEIGVLLGISLSAAKMRLYRATDALRAAVLSLESLLEVPARASLPAPRPVVVTRLHIE